uniref:Fucosyltransferase n=1 Tax=Knipowitschia caucasica TaxID=637954 RepID=A0AAV2JFK9_KNICA
MMFGSVPTVLGPPRDNYEKQIPADAFIHINDFANPKELAERLHYLDKHPEEYRDYFRWRAQYEAKLSGFGKEHASLLDEAVDQGTRHQGEQRGIQLQRKEHQDQKKPLKKPVTNFIVKAFESSFSEFLGEKMKPSMFYGKRPQAGPIGPQTRVPPPASDDSCLSDSDDDDDEDYTPKPGDENSSNNAF